MTDTKAIDYLRTFGEIPPTDLKAKYPAATDEGVDFLSRILTFNPYFRLSVEEAINHPFLQKVRKQQKEQFDTQVVQVPFEKEELDKDRLRQLFLEQFSHFKALRTP